MGFKVDGAGKVMQAATPEVRDLRAERKDIVEAFKSWHDTAAVSDEKVAEIRGKLEGLASRWDAQTGHNFATLGSSSLKLQPVFQGAKSVIDEDGWVRARFSAGQVDTFGVLGRNDKASKSWDVKFNLFQDPIVIQND